MRKSKEGSTLIVTIILFMFATIVSIAFLSMITSNYYNRVSENKRIQNLYGSDSGLDVTYNIIAKTIEASSVYGSEEVKKFKKDYEEMDFSDYTSITSNEDDLKILYALYADIEYWKYYNANLDANQAPINQATIDNNIEIDKADIDKLINKVFKDRFKKFIQDELKISVEGSQYIQYVKKNGELVQETERVDIGNADVYVGEKTTNDIVNKEVILKPSEKTVFILNRTLKVESGYDDKGKIKYDTYTSPWLTVNDGKIQFDDKENYFFYLAVTSEFKSDGNEENTIRVGENLRIAEADYSIRVPNYSEVAFIENINVANTLKDLVGLTIGGNMNVNDVNKLNVTGDIFVQGTDKTIYDTSDGNRTYDKYSGGVMLNNSNGTGTQSIINFNNNVFTRGSFNVRSHVDIGISGDLYARNIYAGNENVPSDKSSLTVLKQTVVNNDLTVKATNTEINLTDFYGINDKNIDEGKKFEKSSSIIINYYQADEGKDHGVKISNEAYIMGVAHINTESGYQTGESVAVKDNYAAYSVPDSSLTEKFVYDNPLMVLDGADITQKAEHFYNYWHPMVNSVNCGGVILNKDKTYSIGAVVYRETDANNNSVEKFLNFNNNKTDAQVKAVIDDKKSDYAKNIYNLVPNNINDRDALLQQYTNNLTGTDTRNVSDILTGINDLTSSDYKPEYINDGKKIAVFTPESRTVVIEGVAPSKDYTGDDNYVVINATSNKNVNAVIVTGGNVIIDGEVNFRGNIIANGNLDILKDSTVNIYYDKNITQDIQKNNSTIFTTVFGAEYAGTELSNEALNIKSNSNSFLRTRLWKVIR